MIIIKIMLPFTFYGRTTFASQFTRTCKDQSYIHKQHYAKTVCQPRDYSLIISVNKKIQKIIMQIRAHCVKFENVKQS